MLRQKTVAALAAALLSTTLWAGEVAKVNGQAVPESHLKAILDKQLEQGQKETKELREAIREELIRRTVIEQAAKAAKLDQDEKVKAEMALAQQGVLLRHYLTQYLQTHPVSEEEKKEKKR